MKPLDPSLILSRLEWPAIESGPVDLVLDTDTYNEIDDQFALVYAAISPQRIDLQAVHAAPFHNDRSTGPADGMAKSYNEIVRVMRIIGRADVPLLRGSESWMPQAGNKASLAPDRSVASDARDDLIERALAQPADRPLYVAAIGAPTNVASAILTEPAIRDKIVVLWLAGQPLYWPTAVEFNLMQDPHASGVLLDSGVPLVLFPCRLVAEMIKTTVAELDAHLDGRSDIGGYLARVFRDYEHKDVKHPGHSKEIWDLAPLTWLMNEAWVHTTIESSPLLSRDLTWSVDRRRHPIRVAQHIHRDGVFADLFEKAART